MTDYQGVTYHAAYDRFRVEDEEGLYRLHVGAHTGDAGES